MKIVRFNGNEIIPSKIVCIGRNYADHIAELGNATPSQPVVFIKPNSAISSHIFVHPEDDIHYETEVAFIVQQRALVGVGLGLDLTKRSLQSELKAKGLPWERAKAFDHSAVFTHFLPFDGNCSALRFELLIDGRKIQSGRTELMLFKPDDILANVSQFLTMEDGDIIMTGTPKGVGEIRQGALFEARLFNGDNLLIDKEWLALRWEEV